MYRNESQPLYQSLAFLVKKEKNVESMTNRNLGSPSVSTCNLKFGSNSSNLLFASRGHSCGT